MGTRLELQTKLETIMGNRNVYFQPPESIHLQYPAIVYKRVRRNITNADDKKYLKFNCYNIVLISKTYDHPAIEKLEDMQYCFHDTEYCTDGLYHDVFTLYY